MENSEGKISFEQWFSQVVKHAAENGYGVSRDQETKDQYLALYDLTYTPEDAVKQNFK